MCKKHEYTWVQTMTNKYKHIGIIVKACVCIGGLPSNDAGGPFFFSV